VRGPSVKTVLHRPRPPADCAAAGCGS
jgi:hypothetical protein